MWREGRAVERADDDHLGPELQGIEDREPVWSGSRWLLRRVESEPAGQAETTDLASELEQMIQSFRFPPPPPFPDGV